MCWSIRVYWTVLHNLFIRFFSKLANACSCSETVRLCYYCCSRCCDYCNCFKHKDMRNLSEDDGEYDPVENSLNLNTREHHREQLSRTQHDYVIVDDIDANYLQIEKRKIETEIFYRTIDRATAEDILMGREDGTCLVRPYKETDISIKYIVSIYAQQQFFHLFIRQIKGEELFAIGQEKDNEKYFKTPNDIIEFYKHNILQCTNKQCSLSLVLRPIIV